MTQKDFIKKCEKLNIICITKNNFFDNYHIFIPIQEVYSYKNKNKLLLFLLASKEKLSNISYLDKFSTIQIKLTENNNTDCIINKLVYSQNNCNFIIFFTPSEKDNDGYEFFNISVHKLYIKKQFAAKVGLQVSDYLVENKFIKKKDSLFLDSHIRFEIENTKNSIVRQLERRYSFKTNLEFTNDIDDKTKIINIMDKNILRTISCPNYNDRYSLDCVLINPNLSYFAGNINKKINLTHLLALFDITEKEMLNIIKKVKSLTNPIVSIGFGGLMSNFFYWCEELRQHFDLDYIFKQLCIYEHDSLDFTNLFRMPVNWKDKTINCNHIDKTIEYITNENNYSLNKYDINKLELQKELLNLSPKTRINKREFRYIELKNAILIGSPDLDTRLKIYDQYAKTDKYFICATHKNNSIRITSFPKFDRELVVETYGTLDLNRFLLSMFKTTIEILKILANKEFKNDTFNHLEWEWRDNNFIENSKKHKCLNNIAYAIN